MKLASLGVCGPLLLVTAACARGPVSVPSAVRGSSLDNPAFLAKLADPNGYRVDHHPDTLESICGQNDLKQINSFTGKLDKGVDFARLHKAAVGAMAEGNLDNSAKYCTGTLVGPDQFITAGHCVDATTIGQYVAFNYEYNAGSTSELLQQDFYKIVSVAESGAELDYTIINLDGHPGDKWGWATVRTNQAAVNDVITIIQHPDGAPKQIDVGHVSGYQGTYLTYADLDTNPGSSGSGIIDASGNLIGIHTNGGCTDTAGTNSGVRLNAAVAKPLVAKLAAITLPFTERGVATLTVAGQTLALAADVGGHAVSLAHEGEGSTVTRWSVVDLHDGSFNLKATDAQGRSAYLSGDSGNVTLRDAVDQSDYSTKWRVVETADGRYSVRAVAGLTGSHWLGTSGNAVALTDAAGAWSIAIH